MIGKFVIGVAMLLEQNMTILLGKRSAGNFGAGLWEFPSGRLESGETPFEGVIREGREELNLDLTPIQIIDAYTFKREEDDLMLLNILCNFEGVLRKSDEHDELKWVKLEEVDNYFRYESQIATKNHLVNYLNLLNS